jgi:hypothetical protein
MKQFESLFHDLDSNLKRLRIATYGLSDTTLEEVCARIPAAGGGGGGGASCCAYCTLHCTVNPAEHLVQVFYFIYFAQKERWEESQTINLSVFLLKGRHKICPIPS